jgi:hypothetical protein
LRSNRDFNDTAVIHLSNIGPQAHNRRIGEFIQSSAKTLMIEKNIYNMSMSFNLQFWESYTASLFATSYPTVFKRTGKTDQQHNREKALEGRKNQNVPVERSHAPLA